MLHQSTVDTTHVPPADRFGVWLDLIARSTAPLRIRTEHAHDFPARAEFIELGPIQLATYRYPSLEATRTRKLVRQSDPECYLLALTVDGESAAGQAGRRSALRPGEFTFYDGSRPHDVSHHGADDGLRPASSTVAIIPHSALPLTPQRLTPLLGGRMSGTDGIGALLAQYLLQVATHPEQYHASDAARLGTIGLDLASTMLGRHLVAEDAIPAEARRRALLTQIQAYVQRHLGDATLSPQVIADAHHISLRTLHRLFEAEESTVAGYVRDLRLARCRHDLLDPALRQHPIQAIAARWGFPDKAHFSRVFRAAHGMSPQTWRSSRTEPARIVNRSASAVNSDPAD
ncbi:helix-turn-helix domain-containing protein [Micromonospora sp. C28SCA-DRY-2]|uniref:AraC-like ligand-binding domain-containing protein n=1 Tax=Micromonospora sp. C28SCA-DRY-2 TaxID=3059522 RepID=UPI00267746E4|nr:helix-turn-helix domain-containing protein [Micromonospora sp. C28SCA-DRY-2]MDO3704082.1 helix-turn-helix domain-containing protein [Micromonospora sp. C28SCA-DRY-2]